MKRLNPNVYGVHQEPAEFRHMEAESCVDCSTPTRTWLDPHAPLCESCAKKRGDVIPKDERALHDQFERWLRVHEKGPIPYVHSRMDRKSTIRKGWPDFTILRGALPYNHSLGSCCVEFKMPGEALTDAQVEVHIELKAASVPVKTCYSVVEAIEFTREILGL